MSSDRWRFVHVRPTTIHPGPAAQVDNGDEARYADKSGTYTKGVLQEGIGLVDLAAYTSFKHALSTGKPGDFEKIVLGGPRTLNGPRVGWPSTSTAKTPASSRCHRRGQLDRRRREAHPSPGRQPAQLR